MRSRHRPLTQVALALAAIAGPAAALDSLQTPVDPRLRLEILVRDLVWPTSMAFLTDGSLLILQKNDGRVLRVVQGAVVGTALDVGVQYDSEQGMLGIAVDPEFALNGHVYLLYTESASGTDTNVATDKLANRLYRYRFDGTSLVEPRLLLELLNTPGPHVGGVLAFGPDDKLYVMVGDMASFPFGQLQNNPGGVAPNDRGVVLRLNVDGSAPTDNPFFGAVGGLMNRVYAYGIRNSFGIGFDPLSGSLWQSENGPESYDEVNRIPPRMNGGHAPIWGPDARDPESLSDLWFAPGATYVEPQISWLVPPALTSIAFVESRKLGCAYEHDLLVGSFACRVIYRFDLDPARQSLTLPGGALVDRVVDNATDWCVEEQGDLLFASGPQFNSDSTTDIENGPDGLVYVLSISHGNLRRFVPVPGAVADADADQVGDACDCAPADASAYAPPVEVPRLRLSQTSMTRISWNPQGARAGPGTGYTLVAGPLGDLRASGGFGSACTLASGLTAPLALDSRPLAAGEGLYYLVRAGNACGNASFGNGSGPADPRDALDAALPPSCPIALR